MKNQEPLSGFGTALELDKTDKERRPFPENLVRGSKVLEKTLHLENRFLPEDHQVVRYLQERVHFLFPDLNVRVQVMEDAHKPNASSLASGDIIITKGLLALLENQDEVDFVLAHEAVHYQERHIWAIQSAHQSILRRLSPLVFQDKALSQDMAFSAMRAAGEERLAEYEADIRGVITTAEGKVNPAAARSAFLKLDSLRIGRKGRDVAHGGNIDRIINIGIVSDLIDYEATARPPTAYPDFVLDYRKTPDPMPTLVQQLERITNGRVTGHSIKDEMVNINTAVSNASIGEMTMALRLLEDAVLLSELNKAKPPALSAQERSSLRLLLVEAIQQRVDDEFTELEDDQRSFINHLIHRVGVHKDAVEVSDEPYGKDADVMTEVVTVEDFRRFSTLLTPELFNRLGIITDRTASRIDFIVSLLQLANESNLFTNATGEFDTTAYIRFSQEVVQAINKATADTAQRDIVYADITRSLIDEAIASLNLRTSKEPLFKLCQEFVDSGVKLYASLVREIVQQNKHSRLTDDELKRLDKILMQIDQSSQCTITIQQLRDRYQFNSDKREASGSFFMMEYDDVTEEEESYRQELIPSLERFIHSPLQLQAYLEELGDMMTMDEKLEYTIPSICGAVIEHGGFGFPGSPMERSLVILAMLNGPKGSLRYFFDRYINDTLLAGHEDLIYGMDDYFALTEIVTGVSSLYAQYGFEPGEFRPGRLAALGMRKLTYDTTSVNGTLKIDEDLFGPQADIFTLHDLAVHIFADLACMEDKDKIFEQFKRFMEVALRHVDEFPKPDSQVWGRFIGRGHAEGTFEVAASFVDRMLSKFEYNLDDPEDQERLLLLSTLFDDPSMRARLQHAILRRRLGADTDFATQVGLLFTDPRTKLTMSKDLREEFIEQRAQTHDELRDTTKALSTFIDAVADPENAGGLVIIERLADIYKDKREIFTLLMNLDEHANTLRSLFFESLRQRDVADEGAILEADLMLERIVHSNDLVRYAVIRNLLVSEDGLLMSQAGREWLLSSMLNDYVAVPKTPGSTSWQVRSVLTESLTTLVREAEPDMLFFSIAPVIMERIMQPTNKPSRWKSILREIGYLPEVAEQTMERVEKLRQGESVQVEFAGGRASQIISAKEVMSDSAQGVLVEKLLESEPKKDVKQATVKAWTPEQFVVRLAEGMGSPGVRFLQVIGQYVDLPPELDTMFEDVYDNVKGQSKLTAYHTMRREWPTFSTEISKVVERIGGGSLMSAYKCERSDGSHEVVKVLNPNALMRVQLTMGVLRRTFNTLAQADPDRYSVASALIDEIESWIIQDVQYPGFIQEDKLFKQKYDGFTADQHRYAIYIPESYPVSTSNPDNVYVKREEYIEGKTLQRALPELDPTARKEAVSLITKHFFSQIFEGQVHSDVHPGNFILFTRDGREQIAVIDRNNYLQLGAAEQTLLFQLQASFSSPTNLVEPIYQYVATATGADIDAGKQDRIQADVAKELAGATTLPAIVSGLMLAFKREQVKIPLTLTLIAKNMNALQHMARQAGFESVQDAYAYAA